MKKGKKLLRRAILTAAALALAAAVAVPLHRALHERREGGELAALLGSLTYAMEENDLELQRLLDYRDRVEGLSRRDAAEYYRALTKLYMLRADADNAFLTFVDGQINAEIARAYDVAAWLYADIAQVYIDFYNYDRAMECLRNALNYAEDQPLESFFYEYCYVSMADLCARVGKTEAALRYYERSLDWDADDRAEYQPMDQRRQLVLAAAALAKGDFVRCGTCLDAVGAQIDALEYPPLDALWASGIYFPYLQLRAELALRQQDYELALTYMEGVFAAGSLYGQVGSLMNFLTEVIALLDNTDLSALPPETRAAVEDYTQRLILEYPASFQERNITAGEHIYNSNMVTVHAFVQQHRVESFYRVAAESAVAAAAVIGGLILVWRSSERRGRIDGLTGAFSRKYFNKVYARFSRGSAPYGVIMYDIDYFKQINDGNGHEAGDAVLRDISRVAMDLLEKDARLFRYGGDEFCVLSRRMSGEELCALAEAIRGTVERMTWKDFEGLRATLSMGVAAADGGDLLPQADANLYRSKEAGRNRVSC